MRYGWLVLIVVFVGMSALTIGVYAGYTRVWPVPLMRIFVNNTWRNPDIKMDWFGRLRRFPGKTGIACPAQNETTAVLLVAGQSNAANAQGQRYESPNDSVVNFSEGHCYRAASPLLGADDTRGEDWTLLGMKLIRSGLYNTVILIPAAVGGSTMHRWATGGDLNAMLSEVIHGAQARYTITAVLWDQGANDTLSRTPEDRYRTDLKSLIAQVRAEGVTAPFFITRTSIGGKDWTPDNPVARAQAAVADGKTVFDGPNTDRDINPLDRFDGYHLSARGQEKCTDLWLALLRAHSRLPPE
jgi:hypothetical protein